MFRRHSRRYSASPGSYAAGDGSRDGQLPAAGDGTETLRFGLGAATAISLFSPSHSGTLPQLSQLEQRSHLGVSPKWIQICRWRQRVESTNLAITRFRSS